MGIERLLEIMARLRDPDGGCPWDLEQSFASIAPYTIEEAYEVADAIERGDLDALRGELGDLLLQVVYHAQLAREARTFTFEDVVESICDKLVRRHPHVFSDERIDTAAEQTRAWEAHKAAEREARPGGAAGPFDDVPRALPALARAVKLQRRALRAGLEADAQEPLARLDEALKRLRDAARCEEPAEAQADALGDALFAVAALAHRLELDPEDALRRANARFERSRGSD